MLQDLVNDLLQHAHHQDILHLYMPPSSLSINVDSLFFIGLKSKHVVTNPLFLMRIHTVEGFQVSTDMHIYMSSTPFIIDQL